MTNEHWTCGYNSQLANTTFFISVCLNTLLNPNKAGIFKGSFYWGGCQFDPLLFQEELNLFQEELIQLLNNLFKVC